MKLIYKKIFIPQYLLKQSKLSINTIKIYYRYLKITPFFNWRFFELYIGNRYLTIYINVKKIGSKIKDFLFLDNKKIYFEKYI